MDAVDQGRIVSLVVAVGAAACLLTLLGMFWLVIIAIKKIARLNRPDTMLHPHGDVPHVAHQARRPGA